MTICSRARPGRTLGHSRSADLCLPSASRREVSRRPPADRSRREVDFRFPVARQDSQHQVEPSTDSWITSRRRDDYTVVFHLKEPFATLLWNLSDGAIGIVPYGSGDEISRQPIGSGPFRFVSAEQDKEVVLARNDNYWGDKAASRASPLYRRARHHHARSRIAQGQRRHRDQRSDLRHGVDSGARSESRSVARSRHGPGLYGIQSARSHS